MQDCFMLLRICRTPNVPMIGLINCLLGLDIMAMAVALGKPDIAVLPRTEDEDSERMALAVTRGVVDYDEAEAGLICTES